MSDTKQYILGSFSMNMLYLLIMFIKRSVARTPVTLVMG